MCVGQPVSS